MASIDHLVEHKHTRTQAQIGKCKLSIKMKWTNADILLDHAGAWDKSHVRERNTFIACIILWYTSQENIRVLNFDTSKLIVHPRKNTAITNQSLWSIAMAKLKFLGTWPDLMSRRWEGFAALELNPWSSPAKQASFDHLTEHRNSTSWRGRGVFICGLGEWCKLQQRVLFNVVHMQ